MDDIQAKIFEIVAKQRRLDPSALRLDQRLEEIEIESVDLVEIIFAIEDEFDIDIPQDTEAFRLDTLSDVVGGVRRLISLKRAGAESTAPTSA